MTITLPLQPQEEARLIAVAHAKGLSADALIRQALDKILAEEIDADRAGESCARSGADLVAAMRASPYRELMLEPGRHRPSVRDVTF